MKKNGASNEKQEMSGESTSDMKEQNVSPSLQVGKDLFVMFPNSQATLMVWLLGIGTVTFALTLVWTILRGEDLLFAPFGLFLVILFALLTRQVINTKKYSRITFDTDDFVVTVGRKQKTTRIRYDQVTIVHEGRSSTVSKNYVSTINYIEVRDSLGTSLRIDDDTFNIMDFKKELQQRILLTVPQESENST